MKTILIVEDEEGSRSFLARAVARAGFNVLAADCGERALETFRQNKVDIVLMDLFLPDIDGDEVLRQLRLQNPQVAVYLMTGYEDVVTLDNALAIGARGVLTKPLILEKITEFLSAFA
jgi:CheY-like chemotaxis protein